MLQWPNRSADHLAVKHAALLTPHLQLRAGKHGRKLGTGLRVAGASRWSGQGVPPPRASWDGIQAHQDRTLGKRLWRQVGWSGLKARHKHASARTSRRFFMSSINLLPPVAVENAVKTGALSREPFSRLSKGVPIIRSFPAINLDLEVDPALFSSHICIFHTSYKSACKGYTSQSWCPAGTPESTHLADFTHRRCSSHLWWIKDPFGLFATELLIRFTQRKRSNAWKGHRSRAMFDRATTTQALFITA